MTDAPNRPLLRWYPPQAEIIPFPVRLRVGKIRRTAEKLHSSRTQREFDANWRRASADVRRQLERAGIPHGRVEAELRDFRDAVQNDLTRRSQGQTRINDGDVA